MLKLSFLSQRFETSEIWRRYLGKFDNVEVLRGEFTSLQRDAIVSPGNCFGMMDEGVDLSYAEHFGEDLPKRLQALIKRRYHGEMLIGQADIIPTNNPGIPWLISAPVMRIPMPLPRDTVNPYLAMRGILHLWKFGSFENGEKVSDHIESIVVPGMGMTVGKVPANLFAVQAAMAIEEVLLDRPAPLDNWAGVIRHCKHLLLQEV